MAGKRKKSKGRKNRRKDQKKGTGASKQGETTPEEASSDAAAEDAEAEEAPDGDADDASEEPDEDGDGDAAPGFGSKVAAVIEVEEELDDPEARAELIALVAGLTTEDAAAAEEPDDAEDPETGEGVAADGEGEGDTEETDAEDAPLIGRDALVALTQFRDEGVATIPEELILDLGEAASPEERDRLLAAALAHAEMREAIYRVPTESGTTRRWKGVIAGALFTLALLVIPLPPDFLVPTAPQPLTTAERARGLRTALLLQAEQIEAFRAREDRLPRSLAEVETALPGARYVRSSDRLYQLVVHTPEGEAIIFDSAAPDADFDGLGSVLTERQSP